MSMRIDVMWEEDDEMSFRASCAECAYQSHPLDDEEAARRAWQDHACA